MEIVSKICDWLYHSLQGQQRARQQSKRKEHRYFGITMVLRISMGSPKAAFPLIRLHKEQYDDDDSDRLIHFTNDLKDLDIKHKVNILLNNYYEH